MKTQDNKTQDARGEKMKNAAVAAGALASGGAAVYGARQWGKTNQVLRKHAETMAANLTPKEIARQVGAEVSGGAKRTLRGYFPTFVKAGKKVSKIMKTHVKGFEEKPMSHEEMVRLYGQRQKKVSGQRSAVSGEESKRGFFFETPAGKVLGKVAAPIYEIVNRKTGAVVGKASSKIAARKVLDRRDNVYGAYVHAVRPIGGKQFETPASRLIGFGNAEQWRRESDQRYGSPLKGAMGLEKGYYRKDAQGEPLIEVLPMQQAQVIKSTFNKAKKVQKYGTRGGGLLKDAGAVITGKPRERDQAGREKKREWEKPWFKTTARNVAITGAMLVGAKHVAKDPEKWRKRVNKHVIRPVNRKVPDLVKEWGEGQRSAVSGQRVKNFATPAARLLGKFEGPLRKGPLGKLMGPSKVQKAVLAKRKDLLKRVQVKAEPYRGTIPAWKAEYAKPEQVAYRAKAKRVAAKVKKNVDAKSRDIERATRRQKDAVRGLKKGAGIAAGGAVLGGSAMKLHADQPEDRKVNQGARFRNALVGAAAGSFLGGALHAGKSGFKGARVGAALGGLLGAVGNPKRKQVIEELPVASFEAKTEDFKTEDRRSEKRFATPAARVIRFDMDAAMAGWDVRDPRGKSARVFAPGSRQRYRRPKEWHEKKENRDKIAAALIATAGIAGLAGGVKIGKGLKKKLPVTTPAPTTGYGYGPTMGPRSTVRREGFRSGKVDRPRWS